MADGNWTCIPASHAAFTSAGVDLVVLSDSLVADPRMVRDLNNRGVPHLPVRVRDGTGLVGPLVIPGVTSCLDNSQRRLPRELGILHTKSSDVKVNQTSSLVPSGT